MFWSNLNNGLKCSTPAQGIRIRPNFATGQRGYGCAWRSIQSGWPHSSQQWILSLSAPSMGSIGGLLACYNSHEPFQEKKIFSKLCDFRGRTVRRYLHSCWSFASLGDVSNLGYRSSPISTHASNPCCII